MELNKYTELFQQKSKEFDIKNNTSWDNIYKIGLSILNEEMQELNDELAQVKSKLSKPKKKVKKAKYDKRIEKKVINLIITYRKTTKEIKDIILEENKIQLSDRSINEIKSNNNIKGYRVVKTSKES